MTKLKIKVSRDSINNGECGNNSKCAIALEIGAVLGEVAVGHDFIFIEQRTPKYNLVTLTLPQIARDFIREFDEKSIDRNLLPEIEFEINLPNELINTIDISALTNHPNLQLCSQD
jgi:hypothetical protein